MKDPSTTLSGLGGTIAEDLLEDGYIGCTSCHEKISQESIDSKSMGFFDFHNVDLRISNEQSRLCLVCHNI